MYSYSIREHKLEFIKPAKTSRNVFKTRTIYLIELKNKITGKVGLGEAAPLSLLSVDDVPEYASLLSEKLELFCEIGDINGIGIESYPSIRSA